MAEFKHTIKSEVSYTGVGLHSGEISTIRFKPAGKDEGIVFIRTLLSFSLEAEIDGRWPWQRAAAEKDNDRA